ncbi:cAMP-dependent protein kinase type II regulatory subunit [Trichoplax sp. H2]|uniref:cAMP-dependent protein kinase type II regulatory subunit n=1 Tax=Trichoplax adhaerens TaxID=10228 RepID=B3RUK5_TRIAD|nr:hypothetical protein TRIADDRAFT_55323 [Trichoplax adhaerens]EDV25345.1 hypothetical protein TRIADDRAFT_55323 [Trichoplax adhaerens]RDD42896.1 cAMP-dependent protein kinase type II regulatory subunit [Trichoplax sp. H2]|eukprot:XP_002111378.1 hypothetical protein TRIADDRAFT_55323 [Trichoplax adhaerens]
MTANDFEIPKGLTMALQEFTVSLIKERPNNIYDYAASYFTRLLKEKERLLNDEGDYDEDEEIAKLRYAKRQSVCAESYQPEEDEEGENAEKIVLPKTEEQRKRLEASVKSSFLFKALDEDQTIEVLDAMFERKVKVNEDVIVQGDDGDNFYVIDQGTYDIIVDINGTPKTVATYTDSGSFGELALMYNTPRAATITARTEGVLWALDRKTFRRILLSASSKKRKMYEELIGSVEMLSELEAYERTNLADALESKKFKDNDVIIKQGDDADAFYFVEKGQCRVIIQKGSEEKEVARLGKGDYFGELALVTHSKRAASVYAVGDTSIAALEVGAFERLLGPCMEILKRNMTKYQDVADKLHN